MKLLLLRFYWKLTRAYLRLRGAEVGKNVRCNGFPHVKIRKGGRLIIEDDVMLNAAPWANAHVTAGSFNLFVAAGATLYLRRAAGVSGTRIVAIREIDIGPGTFIGGGCLICDSNMHEIPLGSKNPVRCEPIHIGNRVFIGAQCVILKGIKIGDGAVIAAGSIVSKSVPARCLAAGNPAKVCKEYRD
jgi:acetyltransferase-like isoleucine patch superfamily enzyme